MKSKYKTLIIIIALLIFMTGIGITYSMFRANSTLNSSDVNVAKFIVNAESLNELNISLLDLTPGMNNNYLFSVGNSLVDNTSDVTLEYKVLIKTYHFVPITIKLYKIVDEEDVLVIDCNEQDFTERNELNELVCSSETFELAHTNPDVNNYKLEITFPIENNDSEYSDLVDYINIELESSQKTN